MSVSALVPRILHHIDVEKWGPRKAELLTYIANFQGGAPNPVPLGRRTLLALGRTPRQAKYDHEEVLLGLAADGVLMRWKGTGTRPDAWAVAELARWRKVPWTTPRRDVLKRFSRPLPDAAVSLWPDRAGQTGSSGQISTPSAPSEPTTSSVDRLATTARHLATSAQPEREIGGSPGHNSTDGSPPSPSYSESEFTPSLGPPQGGSESEHADPGNKLLQAARSAARTSIMGVMADRVRAVGRTNPDRIDQLMEFAATLRWAVTASGVVQALEAHADSLYPVDPIDPVDRVEGERRYLERMIAIYERDGYDQEVIEPLKSRLADLGPA